MNITQIDKELLLNGLKIKLLIALKYFLNFEIHITITFFDKTLDILKQKYSNVTDLNFIESIKNNINSNEKNINITIQRISGFLYNYNNISLIKDMLNSIDGGINYKLERISDNLENKIIENTNISLEQNICLERIEEKINN